MALFRVSVAIAVLMHGPIPTCAKKMDCGDGVPLCGVLTLESGLGKGFYHHKKAAVHGLWPETGDYGNSECIQPKDSSLATKVYSCYGVEEGGQDHILSFENHEWTKHGSCAGVVDVDDFFKQVCGLSQGPLEHFEKSKEDGADFDSMIQALKRLGYPVWSVDKMYDQVLLSACAGNDGRWVLSSREDMRSKCAGKWASPARRFVTV